MTDPTTADLPMNSTSMLSQLLPAGSIPARKYQEEDGKHRGVAGVGRDILGTLGDFLLTKLGLPAMYAPAQKNRRLAAAQAGYSDDPLKAIDQTTSIDPVFGAKLRDQYIDNQRLAVAAADTAETRVGRLAIQKETMRQGVLNRAASYFNGVKDDAGYQAGRQLWQNSTVVKANPELADELNGLYPETYDPNNVATSVGGASTVNQQVQARQRGEKMQADEDYRDKNLAQKGDIAGQTHQDRVRGQDLSHGDRIRGQDLTHGDRVLGQTVRERVVDKRIQAQKDRDAAKPPKTQKVNPTPAQIAELRRYVAEGNQAKVDSFNSHFGAGMSKRWLGQ